MLCCIRQVFSQENHVELTTHQSIDEDFSSFFTLMESIYIGQFLKQVYHSYGNMCWMLRTTRRAADTQ